MARLDGNALPIIPLPRNKLFLPGANQRIDVRSIGPLLSSIYERSPVDRPGAPSGAQVVCVPISSSKSSHPPWNGEHHDVSEKEADMSSIKAADLFTYGVSARVVGIEEMEQGQGAVMKVQGIARCRVKSVSEDGPFLVATDYEYCPDQVPVKDRQLRELFGTLKTKSIQLASIFRVSSVFKGSEGRGWLSPVLAGQLLVIIMRKEPKDAARLADFMANILNPTYDEKLQILAAVNVKTRLQLVIELLQRETSELSNVMNITSLTVAPQPINRKNRPVGSVSSVSPLTSILAPPGFGPGGSDDSKGPSELEILQQNLDAAKLPPEARKLADRELKHLKNMMPGAQEYAVTVNWLETLAEVPWSTTTNERLGPETLTRARKQLDDDHYGLEKVKKRLVEYLAVLRLKQSLNDEIEEQIKLSQDEISKDDATRADGVELPSQASTKVELLKAKRSVDKPPILLLAGPPGVGKTSLAKSVATALGRKFHRISLGGVRDEPEIRGHRRTYVAAMPGVIVQGLKKVGVANPVILLDEIDKLGKASNVGDPSAAMLEVLDPEQNHTFTDHYLGTPLDLSKCLFIASANNLETIPAPLLDRMETIYLPGYTTMEKRHIAIRHLIPKQIRANGLSQDQVVFDDAVVSKIIESYTRESGVRNLERELGSVCRAKAVEYTEAKDSGRLESYRPGVTADDVEAVLGIERFEDEIAEKTSRPGIVTGLVAYSMGGYGSILFIEVADMPGDGNVQLTGRLGEVLKESVEVALTWVKAHAFELGLTTEPTTNIMEGRSIHVHCPSGAIPKDGPSSGIAQAIALISLFSGNPVPPAMAMTGEISLRGRVTAVGGIKEKLIGALRAGVKTVLLPAQNRKDLRDLPAEVTEGLDILFVSHIWEAIRLVWPNSRWAEENQLGGIESRL